MGTNFHQELQEHIDNFVEITYRVTKNFPKEELFGLTSQFRRAALSVALNYVEGYARNRKAVFKNFLEISYGSLKEATYIAKFSHKQKLLNEKDYRDLTIESEEIGKMLWGIIKKLSRPEL